MSETILKQNDTLRTPAWVLCELGKIDLDPCAGTETYLGDTNYALDRGEDGLSLEWSGFVFCNPPFSQKNRWIKRMIEHNNGILLLPERGSAPWFGPTAYAAGGYFVMGKKINFIGGGASNNVGSVLFPFGQDARLRLLASRLPGHFVTVATYRERGAA